MKEACRKRTDYYEIKDESYIKLFKFLFEDEFKELSNDAKILYCHLRDRTQIVERNTCEVDDNGDIYIYFSREETMDKLCIGKDKAIDLFKQLKEYNLIEEVKQGLGKPNKIYVLKITKNRGQVYGK